VAFTPAADLLLELGKKAPDLLFWVRVFADSSGSTNYTFTDRAIPPGSVAAIASPGPAGIGGTPASLRSITPVARSVDVFTRKMSIGALTVSLLMDDHVRDMVVNNGVKGAMVWVYIGSPNVNGSQWERIFSGTVEGVHPRDGTTLDLKIKGLEKRLTDVEIVGAFPNIHPIDAIEDIIQNKVGLPATEVDNPSLTSGNYPTISHWICHRAGQDGYYEDRAISDPRKSSEVINELLAMIDGMLITNRDDELELRVFDDTAPAVDHWTDNDIDTLQVNSLYDQLVNRVTIRFGRMFSRPPDDGGYAKVWTEDDIQSQDVTFRRRISGGDEPFIAERKFDNDWLSLNPVSIVPGSAGVPASGGVGTSFSVWGSGIWSLSGVGNLGITTTAIQKLNSAAGRTAYWLIDNEIIEIDLLTPQSGLIWGTYWDPVTQTDVEFNAAGAADARIAARGQFGTTPAAHGPGRGIVDMTVAIAMAQKRIGRFSNGAWQLTVTTGLDKIGYELGDIITLENDRFVAVNQDGLTATTKWEITGKQINRYSEPPHIEWDLVIAYHDTPLTISPQYAGSIGVRQDLTTAGNLQAAQQNSDVFEQHVQSGFGLGTATGLNQNIDAGVASSGLSRTATSAKTITVPASRDTYVFADRESQALRSQDVAISAPAPAALPNELLLYKITSGASTITGTTDLRGLRAMSGQKLVAESVDTNEIAPLAVTGLQLSAGAVTAGKIGIGGISASNQFAASVVDNSAIGPLAVDTGELNTNAVTNAKIGPSAVDTDEIADDAVGIQHQNREQEIGASIGLNPSLDMYSRG